MRKLLRATFRAAGYVVIEAATGREGLSLFTSHNPDLVLLDLGLPDQDGIAMTRGLRELTETPILVISARGREDDKVAALDAGADDYVTKPFSTNELLARARVALRHAARRASPSPDPVARTGALEIDFAHRRVLLRGAEVHLTPIEYKMLATLAAHLGKVVTHRQLLMQVWGPSYGEHTHYVRVHMAQLRRKLEADPTRPVLLATETGVGYRLRETQIEPK